MQTKKLPVLPNSDDVEFWQDAETYHSKPVRLSICKDHTKDKWMDFTGYVDNGDGTVSCKYCGWGFIMPGNMRVIDEKVVNLWKPKVSTGE